jgi:hypothetical protein
MVRVVPPQTEGEEAHTASPAEEAPREAMARGLRLLGAIPEARARTADPLCLLPETGTSGRLTKAGIPGSARGNGSFRPW